MRLCVGTAKGIVILDPARGATPLMVLADPSAVWCMAQDAADPNLIYAGSTEQIRGKGTLARSTDGGRTWTDVTPPLAREEEVWSVAASPAVKDRVFVGTSHARLFRSDDRGRVFKESDGFLRIPGRDRWTFPPPPHIPHVRSIAFDPHEPSTMYVGVEEGGVFRSRNEGATFETLNDGLYEDIHTVAVDSRDSRRLYATTGGGFYLSNNAGKSWEQVTRGLNRTYTIPLLVSAPDRDDLFTAAAMGPPPTWRVAPTGADAMLFRSADRGESFEPISAEQNFGRGMVMRIKADPENGGFFAVCNDGAVIRASTDGASLTTLAEKLPPAYDLAIIP
ncbi:WD40/YVTN/BNR-like repeat-containing protein [Candidatus Binatus sp.]|uniref:WD40/YVTN/BNR-like repeat-containing protein n=3 Tax=Candidatus Binatus sp. TaxID=2811406 RepID=UPI003C532D70